MVNNILCCDWGTSSFRLRLVDAVSYKVIAENQSGSGVAETFKLWQEAGQPDRLEFYASRLRGSISQLSEKSNQNLSNIPVIVSGMASSSIGMEEMPYATLPFAIDGSQASSKVLENFNGSGKLVLVSGVRSDNDVMRGEEAQLIGLFNIEEVSFNKNEDLVFVFPGTHSKHINVIAGSITGFKTFMTGEIFSIVAEHSILRDSLTKGTDLGDADNIEAYITGVENSGNSNLLNTLFTVRTNQLFSKFTKEQNSYYLSGLLIGKELRQLLDEESGLVICAGTHLFNHYKLAALSLKLTENITFIQPDLIDKATIAGQIQLFKATI